MVSLIIPDCIDGIYLQRCINSIRRQTYRDIEIVAIFGKDAEGIEIEGVKCLTSDGGLKSRILAALDETKGEHIVFSGYECVLAPNLISELVKADELLSESFYVANEVVVSDTQKDVRNISKNILVGKLFKRDYLKTTIEQSVKGTYSDGVVMLADYKKEYRGLIKHVDAYYYTSETKEAYKANMPYDKTCYENTLNVLRELDEIERTCVEKILIEDVGVPEDKRQEVCDLVCEQARDSYRLMVDCGIRFYAPLYKNACINLDNIAYDRVKMFLMGIEDPNLLDIVLKKLNISYEMFSAMKRLSLHNYKFVVEDNSLFISMNYPDGVVSLSGPELADFVISRFSEGRLGAGTIFKSIKAWVDYKL